METNRNVQIKDYEKDVQLLMLVLQSVGIRVDYATTDLIKNCVDNLSKKGDKLTLKDMATIKSEHTIKWDNYFEKLQSKSNRKNGFYWYEILNKESKVKWCINFIDQNSNDDKKSDDDIDSCVENFLNGYYESMHQFLKKSFDWKKTEEGNDYWHKITKIE